MPESDDAKLTKMINDTKRFTDDGTWLYRFTKGEDESGIFKDSMVETRIWIVPTTAYYNDVDWVCKNEFTPVIEFSGAFVCDSKYHYMLGYWQIKEDRTADDTIRQEGVDPLPMPGIIQCSHFNEGEYLRYCGDCYEKPRRDSISWTDYNVFENGDARIIALLKDFYGEITRTHMTGLLHLGFVRLAYNNHWPSELDRYNINVTYYFNEWFDRLATEFIVDPATGEMVEQPIVPYHMADTFNINYKKGEDLSASRKELMPVRRDVMERRMKVAGTLGAVMRMAIK